MKNKIIAMAVGFTFACSMLTGCTIGRLTVTWDDSDEAVESESEFQTPSQENSDWENADQKSTGQESSEQLSMVEIETDYTIEQPDTSEFDEDISELSDGELEARKQQQKNYDEARQLLYDLPNSKDKTVKINQLDRQILANNAYDFSEKTIVFIGDSITEGVGGNTDDNGDKISYVNYVNSCLKFGASINNGKAGRMFDDGGGEELSLAYNFGNVMYNGADIAIVFAGANDWLTVNPDKDFGNIAISESTSGYSGMVRSFMKQMQTYYSDRDVFFVIMYDVLGDNEPTLNEYLEVQRQLASEYGFNIIELYNIGFMDCTDSETASYFLSDNVHPNDTGYIALGEHIAAELSLYYSQQ